MKIKDGTAEFRVRDQRLKAMVDLFFPVGAIYTCVTKPPWMEEYGEWQEVGAGRVLWGADENHEAGTEIEEGLPDITGTFGYFRNKYFSASGAFEDVPPNDGPSFTGSQNIYDAHEVKFSLSKANPIYGASDTVQPPAYVVHFYQRIS